MKFAVIYPEINDLARINDRREFPPFGILYLAAILEQHNYQVKLIKAKPHDYKFNLTEYELIGFSFSSSATYDLMKKCRFASSYSKVSKIIIGGFHASLYPDETFKDIKPDILCIGESEETIIEILNNESLHSIDGIVFCKNDQLVFTKPRSLAKQIDKIPLPSRHLLNKDEFLMKNRLSNTDYLMTHVMFSRGCPFACHFCANKPTKPRYRSAEHICNELIKLKKEYNIKGFAIVDDNFVVDKNKVIEICASISGLNLKWSALSRVDTIDKETLTCLSHSGCIEIKYGIESGSVGLLKAMNKNISIEQIKNAVQMTYELGIKVKVFIIHGYPGENIQTTNETINLLTELKPFIERISLFKFVPLPGSYVFENWQKFGIHNTKYSDNWNGKYSNYHIHHNHYHWWGSETDFQEMKDAYTVLNKFINKNW